MVSWRALVMPFAPLPVEEKAISWTSDGLFPLPVNKKAVSWTSPTTRCARSVKLSLSRDATIPSHTRLAQRRSGSSVKVALTSEASVAMAGASGDGIRAQLAALLGKPLARIGRIRKTDETPARISVIDIAALITGHNANYASEAVRIIYEKYPEVHEKIVDFLFPGQGQRKKPVTDVQGIVEIVLLLPGRMAARVRRQAADLLVRYPYRHPAITRVHLKIDFSTYLMRKSNTGAPRLDYTSCSRSTFFWDGN